jgi:hypothetical protein
LNFERSGDDWDDREVDRILRKHVFAATLPRLVRSSRRRLTRWTSAPFDTLKRALSKHLKPNTYMSAPGGDSDLAEADGEYAADAEERPRSAGPAGRPTAAVPGAGPGTRSPDRATEPLLYSGVARGPHAGESPSAPVMSRLSRSAWSRFASSSLSVWSRG